MHVCTSMYMTHRHLVSKQCYYNVLDVSIYVMYFSLLVLQRKAIIYFSKTEAPDTHPTSKNYIYPLPY